MALTEADKSRARHHLGYLAVSTASTFVLGIPAGVQTQFMVEAAWDRLLPSGYERFRKMLDRCDKLEDQIECNSENLAASSVGDIELRPDEFKEIIRRYIWWRAAIANMLGIAPNPFDLRFTNWSSGGGGINVRISG